jgi:hypothetical protein
MTPLHPAMTPAHAGSYGGYGGGGGAYGGGGQQAGVFTHHGFTGGASTAGGREDPYRPYSPPRGDGGSAYGGGGSGAFAPGSPAGGPVQPELLASCLVQLPRGGGFGKVEHATGAAARVAPGRLDPITGLFTPDSAAPAADYPPDGFQLLRPSRGQRARIVSGPAAGQAGEVVSLSGGDVVVAIAGGGQLSLRLSQVARLV